MRKKNMAILSCLAIGALFVSPLNALSSNDTAFYLNAGAIADDSFKTFWWQTGAMLDLSVGRNLLLTPEVMFIGYKFDFKELYLYPGATINVTFGDSVNTFFLGGGGLLYFRLKPKDGDRELLLTFHGGIIRNNIKVTAFFYTFTKEQIFKYNYLGLNIGFGL